MLAKVLLPVLALGVALAVTGTAHASSKPPPSRALSPQQAKAIENALRTADPRAMRALAAQLDAAGFKEQADDLREAADAVEKAIKDVPPVKPGDKPAVSMPGAPPEVPVGPPPEALSPAKLLAGKMAIMLTNSSPSREDKKLVSAYQAQEQQLGHLAVGKVDGLYGPKTALTLAKQYGIVPPKPYYWPRAPQRAAAVAAYRSELLTLAAKDVPRAEEWRQAADVK